MKVYERFKLLRRASGLTQVEVCSRLGIKQYNLSDYETGRASPSIEMLIKMAELYEVTVDDLLNHNTDYIKSTQTGNMDVFNEYLTDLTNMKILKRIQKLTDAEKQMIYSAIDSMCKSMFNK